MKQTLLKMLSIGKKDIASINNYNFRIMKVTKDSRNINKETSLGVVSAILGSLDGLPIEKSLDYLNGMTIALAKFIQGIKENVELSDEDGLEKLVLSWLSAIDPFTGLKFSKYISTDCIDIDLNAF